VGKIGEAGRGAHAAGARLTSSCWTISYRWPSAASSCWLPLEPSFLKRENRSRC